MIYSFSLSEENYQMKAPLLNHLTICYETNNHQDFQNKGQLRGNLPSKRNYRAQQYAIKKIHMKSSTKMIRQGSELIIDNTNAKEQN